MTTMPISFCTRLRIDQLSVKNITFNINSF